MADDDMNGNDPHRTYTDAVTAQLGERVTNLGRRQTDLESEMRTGFKQMESAVGALAAEMRNSVASLSSTLAERNRPQWQALGVALSFCTILGALAYWPINSATSDLKASVAILNEKMVTQKEMEWRTARGVEDRKRTDDAIVDLRSTTVSRNEWTERNLARNGEISELSRRIDELRQEVGSVYGTRDVITDLKRQVDTLRQRVFEARADFGRAE